ncbi:hypothetical protein HLB03_10415 [Acidianus sp. DSM 29099]|nr:hypothetical protein [Acidianus sp. RZ1]
MIMIDLDPRDIEVLEVLTNLITISSYKLSKITGIPPASVWRTLVKLGYLNLVCKDGKHFRITARGLVLTYLFTNKKQIKAEVIEQLKRLWKYEGDEREIEQFLTYIVSFLKEHNISPFSICFNQPITIATLLLSNVDEASEDVKKVIARLVLNFFPNTKITEFCKGIISIDEHGIPYALAVDCKKDGVKLFHYCDIINKLYCKKV